MRSLCSAISAGTEMLVYRGQLPAGLSLDSTLPTLSGKPEYPLQYGYATVGEVEEVGEPGLKHLLGKRIFSFQPHSSLFNTEATSLELVPDDIDAHSAVFLANMETAITLVIDGAPLIGERCLVIGQGIVGLLTTFLLSQFPLTSLLAVDGYQKRLEMANQFGADVFNHSIPANLEQLESHLSITGEAGGADLVFELSGEPSALEMALNLCIYTGRVVIGSWYGNKSADLHLGGRFHRNRVKLVSSQVSTIDPVLSGRWNKQRRFAVAWNAIRKLPQEQLISHRIPFNTAADAYHILDKNPDQALQVVLDYSD